MKTLSLFDQSLCRRSKQVADFRLGMEMITSLVSSISAVTNKEQRKCVRRILPPKVAVMNQRTKSRNRVITAKDPEKRKSTTTDLKPKTKKFKHVHGECYCVYLVCYRSEMLQKNRAAKTPWFTPH